MAKSIVIYIEGHDALREGFVKLFYKHLAGRSPFKMMKGKTDAIKKFNGDDDNQFKYLMIDLDNEETKKKEDEKTFNYKNDGNVIYMVQATEAWYISQPVVLEKEFGFDVCAEIKKTNDFTHAKELRSPKIKLKEALQKRGISFKENVHGPALMKKLNLEQLKDNFEDVKTLIDILN
ncbi:MAG TPA: hypothetical protein PLW44_18710 [Chitinophagales bacterium]|nr:hypothetical protein [Chitinophagales bacterium]